MATHSYEARPALNRCVEHEHVDADYPCTWLRVTDANDTSARGLDADTIRELALALAEHAAKLHREGNARRLEITRRLASDLAVDDFAGIRCFTPDDEEKT